MKMTIVHYECNQCQAKDSDKLFPGESPIPCVNCFKCRAGSAQKTVGEQLQARVGMFLVKGV